MGEAMRCSAALIAMLRVTCSLGQAWCAPGATWTYGSGESGDQCLPYQARFVFVGDTVVDGFQAQRIDRFSQVVWQGTLISSSAIAGVTRTNGDVVWDWNGSTWDTLYWFSAVPGEQWRQWPFAENCPNYAWYVLDTGVVVLDGVSLRTVSAEVRVSGIPTGQAVTFTERIGGGGGSIFPFPGSGPCEGVFECVLGFICYRDDELNDGSDCELTLGVPDPPGISTVSVYPNPGNDLLWIVWSKVQISSVEIKDAQGRSVFIATGATTNAPIDVSALANGAYTVHVRGASGEQALPKWIKH